MFISVSVSPAVAATSSGTRRRTCTIKGQAVMIEFSREPLYLHVGSIPPELTQDPHLIIKEITPEVMAAAGGTLTELPGVPKAEEKIKASGAPSEQAGTPVGTQLGELLGGVPTIATVATALAEVLTPASAPPEPAVATQPTSPKTPGKKAK